ncbi:MAG: acyl-ACP--UDP-N-acetylglucosamine O-acyltransferase [Candidatus Kapaibacteriales bacterium]
MIDSKAVVSGAARIGVNVRIGPFAIIEDDVEIGDNCEIRSHAVIASGSTIGKNVRVHAGAVIGTEPQDLKFTDTRTTVIIGDDTVIREYATINRGTDATGTTIVGKNNLIMSYCHVAHDCIIGNNVVISNATQIGGHVELEDWVILGGLAKIHQFCKIGRHSFVGADVKVTKDVPPYVLLGKNPPVIEGVNKIGLKRRDFSSESVSEIDEFYDIVLRQGFNTSDGLREAKSNGMYESEHIKAAVDFIENSKRGIYR